MKMSGFVINKAEHFLKPAILCHCKEKRKLIIPVEEKMTCDNFNLRARSKCQFNQIDIEVEAKSAQKKKIAFKQGHISNDRFEIQHRLSHC